VETVKFLREQSGFTVVELVIALTVTAIITVAVFAMMGAARRSAQHNFGQNYNLLAAKQALSRITDELRYANAMTTPANPGAVGTTTSPSATFTANGVTTKIYQSAGKSLVIEHWSSGGTLSDTLTLAKSMIQQLTFSRNGSSTINAALIVKDNIKAGNPAMNISSTVRMLNVVN
jgi:type II secretory pathway pseudopilin PulG